MERPDKRNYDFNDYYFVLGFAADMIVYCDHLESKPQSPPNGLDTVKDDQLIKELQDRGFVFEFL